jgi:hypothetical protein
VGAKKKEGREVKLAAITYLTGTTVTDEDKLKSRNLLLFSHCELDGLGDGRRMEWM